MLYERERERLGVTYMVLMTPMFPFVAPPNVRNSKACQNAVENPKPIHDILVPSNPIKMTVFLPNLLESATRPHIMAVKN